MTQKAESLAKELTRTKNEAAEKLEREVQPLSPLTRLY